jgi:hypothetical protein
MLGPTTGAGSSPRHRATVEFRKFPDGIEANLPPDLDTHTHTHTQISSWTTRRPTRRSSFGTGRPSDPPSRPFQPDFGPLDQPGRALARPAHRQADLAQRPPIRGRSRARHPPLHRVDRRRAQAVPPGVGTADDILAESSASAGRQSEASRTNKLFPNLRIAILVIANIHTIYPPIILPSVA